MPDFEEFYDSLTGIVEDAYALPGVENAFAPGSLCEKEYFRMRCAYERLCDRLGVRDEDRDLDTMVDALEHIQKDLCRRVFEYRM